MPGADMPPLLLRGRGEARHPRTRHRSPPLVVDTGHLGIRPDLNAEVSQRLFGMSRESRREGGQRPWSRLYQNDPGRGRVDHAVLLSKAGAGEFRQRAG